MGLGEIILIVIVALLFIGPEKLPEAAKSISKGIRDIRKQTRELRETIEEDTEFGGAIRDLQSALRGDDLHASAQARQKAAAMQKSATLKSGPRTEIAVGAPDSADVAGALPLAAATVSPAAEPVIAASAGAVARGGVTGPAAASASASGAAATAGESPASAEHQPGEGELDSGLGAGQAGAPAAGSTPAPGRAHG
jgi:sec-independent protein translocase protein TatB